MCEQRTTVGQYFAPLFMVTAGSCASLVLRTMFFKTVAWSVSRFPCETKCDSFLKNFFTGLFNIGNRLLVSIDLFLKVRAGIKLGKPPSQAARIILDHNPSHPGKHWIQVYDHKLSNCVCRNLIMQSYISFLSVFVVNLIVSLSFASVHTLSPEEVSQIQELLLSGYFAFECLTVRDYNDMICGICGVAPKLEIAQRYGDNVLELKNVEVKD